MIISYERFLEKRDSYVSSAKRELVEDNILPIGISADEIKELKEGMRKRKILDLICEKARKLDRVVPNAPVVPACGGQAMDPGTKNVPIV